MNITGKLRIGIYIFMNLLLAACVLENAILSVWAKGSTAEINLEIRQTIEAEGTDKILEDQILYELVAGTANAPMPAGVTSDKASFSIAGQGIHRLNISYVREGEYSYLIRKATDDLKKGYIYANNAEVFYRLRVQVTTDADGSLLVTPTVYLNDSLDKVADVVFGYEYQPEATSKENGGITPRKPSLTNARVATTAKDAKTGDNTSIAFWAILAAGAIGCVSLIRIKRRN